MGKKLVLYSFISICFVGAIAFCAIKTTQLSSTENTLTSTQNELTTTQANLSANQALLAITDTEITQTQGDLSDAKVGLTMTLAKIDTKHQEIDEVGKEINKTDAAYKEANAALDNEKKSNITLNLDLSALQINYSTATLSYDYALRDPTYQEVKDFLAADTTDLNNYILGSYVCEDFSFDVRENALAQKIRCAAVLIDFIVSPGHVIIAFNTTDRGIIYIEPQSDEEVNLQASWHYWTQCVIPAPGNSYSNPTDNNDIVESFNLIW
jgi:hypothetical protein